MYAMQIKVNVFSKCLCPFVYLEYFQQPFVYLRGHLTVWMTVLNRTAKEVELMIIWGISEQIWCPSWVKRGLYLNGPNI